MKYMLLLVMSLFVFGCDVPDKPQPEPPTIPFVDSVPDKYINRLEYQQFLVTTGITNKDTVMILVDCSGSMDGSKLKQAKESLNIYLDRLPNGVDLRLFTIYNGKINKLTNGYVKDNINSLIAGGGTPLGDGLERLEDEATRIPRLEDSHVVMVVLTDGLCDWNNASVMDWAAQRIIRKGWYLDVIGYELLSNHALSKYASRYRNASEATLTNVLLEKE